MVTSVISDISTYLELHRVQAEPSKSGKIHLMGHCHSKFGSFDMKFRENERIINTEAFIDASFFLLGKYGRIINPKDYENTHNIRTKKTPPMKPSVLMMRSPPQIFMSKFPNLE